MLGRVPGVEEGGYEDFDLSVSHDEAYVYLLLKKREGGWRLPGEVVNVGFGSLTGGSDTGRQGTRCRLPRWGIQFLLQMKGEKTHTCGSTAPTISTPGNMARSLTTSPDPVIEDDPQKGVFLLWKLALNRPLVLPRRASGRIPFEDYEVGKMEPGITDPTDKEFDSLADWYARGRRPRGPHPVDHARLHGTEHPAGVGLSLRG